MRVVCNSVETFPMELLERKVLTDALVPPIVANGKSILAYQGMVNEAQCRKAAFEFEFEGLKAICLNGGGFNSDVFKSVYDESKHDVMMPFQFDGKQWTISLYTTKNEVDCSVIAKSKGKKELIKFKDQFVQGCIDNNTMNEKNASDTFDMLEEFGGYSFNKAHSAAYSMIAYQCMFLKHFYPTEFMSASLSYSGESKIEELIKEAYRLGLSIITPKIGMSDGKKWRVKDKTLYVPFCYIKGIGEKCEGSKLRIMVKWIKTTHGS